MKIWIDDLRPNPEGFFWCKTVVEAQAAVIYAEEHGEEIELISTDHDAGDYGPPDYIKFLDWLESTGRSYPIRLHTMNVVGRENMRRIIQRNDWTEVK